jgi:hypothetical protein
MHMLVETLPLGHAHCAVCPTAQGCPPPELSLSELEQPTPHATSTTTIDARIMIMQGTLPQRAREALSIRGHVRWLALPPAFPAFSRILEH